MAIAVDSLELANRYFAAWNARDPEAILTTFENDGWYADPTTGGPLRGDAIVGYTSALFATYPDLAFELVSEDALGEGRIAAQWVMRGTNTGSLQGLPPTGKTVELAGADFIATGATGVRSVQGYFDTRTLVEQLGLQVLVQPDQIGPFSFGRSTRASTGAKTKPSAFSLTVIEVRSPEETTEVSERGREIVQSALGMPGFISMVTAVVGQRMYTMSAWEDAEAPRALLREGPHVDAVKRMFQSDFAAGGFTSVWVPDHLNALMVRCDACHDLTDWSEEGTCTCGATLPEPPAYW